MTRQAVLILEKFLKTVSFLFPRLQTHHIGVCEVLPLLFLFVFSFCVLDLFVHVAIEQPKKCPAQAVQGMILGEFSNTSINLMRFGSRNSAPRSRSWSGGCKGSPISDDAMLEAKFISRNHAPGIKESGPQW